MTKERIVVLKVSLLAVGATLVVLACSGSASGPNTDLVGTWQSQKESSPPGSYQTTIELRSDGRFTSVVQSFGLYPGQRATDLSAYSRYTGRYDAVRDSLFFHAQQYAWWDRFYGADSPEHVLSVQSVSLPHPGTAYSLIGPRLILHYLSYPADAPVPTSQEFYRIR